MREARERVLLSFALRLVRVPSLYLLCFLTREVRELRDRPEFLLHIERQRDELIRHWTSKRIRCILLRRLRIQHDVIRTLTAIEQKLSKGGSTKGAKGNGCRRANRRTHCQAATAESEDEKAEGHPSPLFSLLLQCASAARGVRLTLRPNEGTTPPTSIGSSTEEKRIITVDDFLFGASSPE